MRPIATILIAVVVSIIASFAVVKMTISNAPQNSAEAKESLYDRVMRTRTIRCGYAPLEPILSKDTDTGKLSGLAYDLMETIGKKLSLQIEWAGESGFASMTQDVASGRYDMICSTHMITAARARAVDFSSPVIFSPLSVFVRQEDDKFDTDWNALNSSKAVFSAIDGTATLSVASKFFPKAGIMALPEMSSVAEVFLAVQSKKANVTIAPAYEGLLFSEKNDGAIRILGDPLILMPFSFQIPQNEYRFKAMIEGTLDELRANGTIEQLMEKYKKYPGALYPSRSPYEPVMQ